MKEMIIFISASTVGYGADFSMISAINEIKKNHECLVILPGKGRSTDLLEKNNIYYVCIPFKQWIHYDTSFVGEYIKPIAKFFINIYSCFKALSYFKKNNIKPILIYSNSFTNYFSIFLSRLTKTPYIQHIREFGKEDFDWHFDIGFERTCALVNKYASRVIAISDSVLNTYKAYFDSKLIRVYNGVPIPNQVDSESESELENDKTKIVMTGRLSFEKGQAVLIDAINLLVQEQMKSNISVDLFGDGPDLEMLKEKVRKYSLENIINFCGYQSNVSLASYDVGVICSTSEGFGRVTVEYMAAKLPVIGANGGATPEIIIENETGYLFPIGDSKELANKLKQVINNKDKAKQLGLNGYERFINHFSQDVYVTKVKNVCEEVLTKGAVLR